MDTEQHEDVLCFDKISGFYGPGAWAGWILAIASSWYTIALQPRIDPSRDASVYILYTNWAAIDLLRQLFSRGLAAADIAPLISAAVVVVWGAVTTTAQITILVYRGLRDARTQRRDDTRTLSHAPKMFWIGQILPAFAIFILSFNLVIEVDARTSFSTHIDLGPKSTRFAWIFGLLCQCSVISATMMTSEGKWKWPSWQSWRPVLMLTVLSEGPLMLLLLAVHRGSLPLACFVRPCAPQNVAEWDQAFCLFCAFVVFGYQVGADGRILLGRAKRLFSKLRQNDSGPLG